VADEQNPTLESGIKKRIWDIESFASWHTRGASFSTCF